MTLRARIALLTAGAVALAVAAAAVVAWLSARNELRAEIDNFLVERATPISLVAPPALREQLRDLDPIRGRVAPGRRVAEGTLRVVASDSVVQIVAADGNIVFSLDDNFVLPVASEDLDVLAGERPRSLRDVEVSGEPFRMLTISGSREVAVQVARSLAETNEVLSGMALRLAVIGLGGVALAAALGWVVARRSLVPVGELTTAAERVADTQDLATPIEVVRRDEVGRLASSFNKMLAALADSRQQQHRLVTDAGHELRTPLTALRTNIEVLARYADMEPEDQQRLLADLGEEVEELSALVAELIDLATERRADEPAELFRLDELVGDVVERARRRTETLFQVVAEEVMVEGRRGALGRAIANLVDNAIKWGPPGSPVTVRVAGGTVAVADAGPGIASHERELVFERFYRADEARAMPGSGLGLAIVKQVVDDHGGRVFATESAAGGAEVGFTLPVAA